jgi:tRNA-dihydrouridine synthase A
VSTTAVKIIAIAPMMDYTDRHDRYFLRLIAPDVRLYTEMITAPALIHGNAERLLAYHPTEKYLALQLGGSDPKQLAQCAKMGADKGYDEINLNVGCPSPRVSSGRFGACLMLEPQLVAECVNAMQAQVTIPVTVKCRIGVDQQDEYATLHQFVSLLAHTGCQHFIIHARKAWLSGLSPKENREIPPLRYEVVHQLKQNFPQLQISINGGIKTLADIKAQLPLVDGVMIGRAAYANPYLLADIQHHYFPRRAILSRQEVGEKMVAYATEQLQKGVRLSAITRHILGLYQGKPGAAAWRRYLSQHSHLPSAGAEVIAQALKYINL